jgi:uncharacterized protein
MYDFIGFLVRRRVAVLGAALLISGVLTVFAFRLGSDNSLAVWFAEDDPHLQAYYDFSETFGSDEVVVIAVHGRRDALAESRLESVASMTLALAQIDGVDRVVSLSSLLSGYANGAAFGLPGGPPPAQLLRESVEGGGMAARLVSPDRRTALLMAWFETGRDIDERRGSILADVRRAVQAHLDHDEEVSFGGIGILHEALNEATEKDIRRFVGIAYLVIGLLFVGMLRRLAWTGAALAVVTMSMFSMLGIMALLGRSMNVMSMGLPVLVMVLGVAAIVHVALHVESVAHRAPAGPRQRGVVVAAIAAVAWPCLFNVLTTAGGFLSLTTSSLVVTRDYGLFAAIGILLSLALAAVVIAALVPRAERMGPQRRGALRMADATAATVAFAMRNRLPVVLGAGVLSLVLIWGSLRIEVNTYSIELLPAAHPARVESARIESTTGAYLPVEYVVRPRAAARWSDRPFILAMAAAEQSIEDDPLLSAPLSVISLLQEADLAFRGAEAGSWWLGEAADVNGLLLRGRTGDLARVVSQKGDALRITLSVPSMTARDLIDRMEHGHRTIAASMGETAGISVGGYMPLYAALHTRVIGDQARSLGIALAVVFCLIALILRSLRFTMIAAPPNLLPILLVLGVMGLANIQLDLATVTVAAAIIGIVVDDSVHLLYRLKRNMLAGLDFEAAMLDAARISGLAVLCTSTIFFAGFSVLIFSSVQSVASVGTLMTIAMAGALATDLLLLPAVASYILDPKRRAARVAA